MTKHVGKYEIVNREFYFFGYTVLITQRYIKRLDGGHYHYVVHSSNNADKFIIGAGQSSGAVPSGRIDQHICKDIYEYALRCYEEWVEYAEEDALEAKKSGAGTL